MTWPVVINGNTYVLADFDPYGYTTALPALFNDLLDVAGSLAGTIPYNFDTTTTDADPGAGDLRLNHATASSATGAYIDNDSAAGVAVGDLLDTFDDAGKTTDRGILRIQDTSTMGTCHFYRVTGSVTDGSGYRKLVLVWIAGAGAFTSGGGVAISFIPRGADGATGSTGDAGTDGNDGWSPVFAIVSDSERRVLQVDDWVGGEGSKPSTGDYVGASGLTGTIGDAVDIRGAAGANGSNGADGADPFYLMTFDTGTSSSGIGGGEVRANNADLSAATEIYVSDTNRASSSIAARILELGAAGKSVKDRIIITNPAADTQASWLVDSITDESGFTTVAVSSHAGATSFSDGLAISLQPVMSGDDGNDGAGAGDVIGPDYASVGNVAIFNNINGKDIDDSGIAVSALAPLASPTFTGTITFPNTGVHILDTNASHDLIIAPGSDLSADRTLTVTTGDADRTIDISAASVTVSAFGATLTDDADASTARTTLGVVIGTNVQAYDATLDAVAAYNTNGILTQTAADTFTGRTITGTANEIDVSNGNGVSGNPTLSLPAVAKPYGKHTIWIPASAMIAATTSGPASAQFESGTYDRNFKVLDFDASADEHAHFNVAFPKGWDEGTVTFQVWWMSSATDTDGVAWALEGAAISDNESTDAAWGTAVVVTDDAQSAASELYVTSESGAVTINGTPAADDACYFRIFRDVSDANDDMTEDARLIGVKIFYNTNAGTDA